MEILLAVGQMQQLRQMHGGRVYQAEMLPQALDVYGLCWRLFIYFNLLFFNYQVTVEAVEAVEATKKFFRLAMIVLATGYRANKERRNYRGEHA